MRAPAPSSKTVVSILRISTKMTTNDKTTALESTSKRRTMIGYQETNVTVMAMMTSPMTFSTTTIENTVPEPSTTEETTTTAPAPSSSTGEEKTTITEPELLMTIKMPAPASLSKATNTDTNTDTMPSIGTAKEIGLLLDPGKVTQDPSHSENISLSPGPHVSYREIERFIKEIESIEKKVYSGENINADDRFDRYGYGGRYGEGGGEDYTDAYRNN